MESGGRSYPVDLAERYRNCNLLAEREQNCTSVQLDYRFMVANLRPFALIMQNNLHMSKKSSTFARKFCVRY